MLGFVKSCDLPVFFLGTVGLESGHGVCHELPSLVSTFGVYGWACLISKVSLPPNCAASPVN